jgi:hypothetical protein
MPGLVVGGEAIMVTSRRPQPQAPGGAPPRRAAPRPEWG